MQRVVGYRNDTRRHPGGRYRRDMAPHTSHPHSDLARVSPPTGAALDALFGVINDDASTLPKWFKHVLVACTCLVKRRPDEARTWIASACDAGATPEAIAAIAVDLVLSRGAHIGDELLSSLAASGRAVPTSVLPGQQSITLDPTSDSIRDYFTGVFGTVPERVALLLDRCVPGMRAYHLLRQAGLDDSVLPAHYMEIVLVVVNAADYQPLFVEVHARGAFAKGATEEQLVEACVCAIPHAGVAAWLPASIGIIAGRPAK
jgi:alkylhydroperoxidase/carboxymuconolactone decarboxylase family protein YurZ